MIVLNENVLGLRLDELIAAWYPGRVRSITELRPGTIQAKVHGIDGVVWVLPDQLQVQQGEFQHPPFEEDVRAYIRQIKETFAEHRSLSFEEWEDGFRRDANPAREIAIWSHAADIYTAFTESEPSAERRKDVYRCIVACLTTGPDAGTEKGTVPVAFSDC